MAQFILRDLTYALGQPPLIDRLNVTLEPGEKVALIGRNGAGKTTLLRLLNQELTPDSGEITRSQGLRTRLLTQKVPVDMTGKVYDLVAAGMEREGALLSRYHEATQELAAAYESGDEKRRASLEKELDRLQADMDLQNAWEANRKVDNILLEIGIDGEADFSTLSAGKKRRVLFAQAIVAEPDVLLLDEPTNHLDIESVLWLEKFLQKYEKSILFVTHDRAFLRNLATTIWELDRGSLYRYDCDYDTYLERREQRLHAEEKELEHFQKKLAQEEIWIRTGIMARRTRNEGRVRALKQMRRDAANIRRNPGTAKLEIHEGVTSGRLVVEAKHLSFSYPGSDKPIFKDFSTKVMRQDRIAIIGPNGVGKTTLLRVLLGEMAQTEGSLRHGTQLQIAYFDQLQATLDEERSVIDNVTDGSTHITINGHQQHILGYLRDFLFSEERAKMPVKFLSGGEKNRILLAKLFTKPSNILVMDEPTNDLDMETLELLEEQLAQYPGTLLLVSHDREFINNVVTSTFVFEGDGVVKEYVGGYDDWLIQRKAETTTPEPIQKKAAKSTKPAEKPSGKSTGKPTENATGAAPARRLNYTEKKELEVLPKKIEETETQLAELHARMSEPGFYQQARELITQATAEEERLQNELTALYERWEELDCLQG